MEEKKHTEQNKKRVRLQDRIPVRKKRNIPQPEGSSGTLPYDPDYSKINVGNTGTNIKKDRNLEKSGSGEAE